MQIILKNARLAFPKIWEPNRGLNNTGIRLGIFYKVPHGFELPFAGRWLLAVGCTAGSVSFSAAGGKRVHICNPSAELLAEHARKATDIAPKSFK